MAKDPNHKSNHRQISLCKTIFLGTQNATKTILNANNKLGICFGKIYDKIAYYIF